MVEIRYELYDVTVFNSLSVVNMVPNCYVARYICFNIKAYVLWRFFDSHLTAFRALGLFFHKVLPASLLKMYHRNHGPVHQEYQKWNMCSINRFMICNMRFRLMLMHIQYDFYFPNFILQMVCVFCHINAGLLLSLYFNVVMRRTRLFYGPKSFSSERRPNK